ncbi:unnamed protein product [Rhodiola kirilowii]
MELCAVVHAVLKWRQYLLGSKFKIYNGTADALSRLPEASNHTLQVVSKPTLGILRALRNFFATNTVGKALVEAIVKDPTSYPDHIIRDGLILVHQRLLVPSETALQSMILHEFHVTPIGGHGGIQRTLARIASAFYWLALRKDV